MLVRYRDPANLWKPLIRAGRMVRTIASTVKRSERHWGLNREEWPIGGMDQ